MDIQIYTSPLCGYCHAAKRLLQTKGADFSEIDLAKEPARREEMVKRSNGGRTVPQIFIDGHHIGGCDELYALERAGKLDSILQVSE